LELNINFASLALLIINFFLLIPIKVIGVVKLRVEVQISCMKNLKRRSPMLKNNNFVLLKFILKNYWCGHIVVFTLINIKRKQ